MLNQKPTVLVLLSTWTLNVSFISGKRLLKKSMIPFVTVVLFLLNMNIVSCIVGIQKTKVAKKAIIYSSITVCVFSCSVLISQRWSLSLTVSASICVVYSHLFHIEKCIKTYS